MHPYHLHFELPTWVVHKLYGLLPTHSATAQNVFKFKACVIVHLIPVFYPHFCFITRRCFPCINTIPNNLLLKCESHKWGEKKGKKSPVHADKKMPALCSCYIQLILNSECMSIQKESSIKPSIAMLLVC